LYLLHRIWQRTGKYPTEILGIPAHKVSQEGLKAFVFASEIYSIKNEFVCPLLKKTRR